MSCCSSCRPPRAIPLPDGTPTRLLAALRQDPRFVLLLLTVVAADTAYRFAYSAVPWQLDALGAAPWIYGTTISLNCALIVLFEPWLAHRLRERAPERLIALGFLLVGVGWVVVAPSPGIVVVLVAVAVVTAGEMLYKPTATAHASDRAPEGCTAATRASTARPPSAAPSSRHRWPVRSSSSAQRLMWVVGGALGVAAAAVLAFTGSQALRRQPVHEHATDPDPDSSRVCRVVTTRHTRQSWLVAAAQWPPGRRRGAGRVGSSSAGSTSGGTMIGLSRAHSEEHGAGHGERQAGPEVGVDPAGLGLLGVHEEPREQQQHAVDARAGHR